MQKHTFLKCMFLVYIRISDAKIQINDQLNLDVIAYLILYFSCFISGLFNNKNNKFKLSCFSS